MEMTMVSRMVVNSAFSDWTEFSVRTASGKRGFCQQRNPCSLGTVNLF
jgi:hypothetical protein